MAQNSTSKKEKIVVGLSGGVDSSVSLALLKKGNWQPIGLFLKLPVWKSERNLVLAKKVCKKLGVPFYVLNAEKEFKKEVLDYFVEEIKRKKTPNPCIICNYQLKFKKLFQWAKKHQIKYVATGHYAKIKKNQKTGRYELLIPKDREKDQTYFLSSLSQKYLKHIIFPLAEYKKEKVYKIAREMGFNFLLKKKQSQEFCFLAKGSLNQFLKEKIGTKPGVIKDSQGKILGSHQGLHFYTLGQRKGINLAGGPYFVKGFEKKNNVLLVSKDKKELLKKRVCLSSVHFISTSPSKKETRVMAKLRYRQRPARARLYLTESKKGELVFDKPQMAPTPGQFAVFYKKNTCLGNGVIINSF